jgi:hypothetical protein
MATMPVAKETREEFNQRARVAICETTQVLQYLKRKAELENAPPRLPHKKKGANEDEDEANEDEDPTIFTCTCLLEFAEETLLMIHRYKCVIHKEIGPRW